MEQSLIADLRQLPIEDFLARLGYQPVKGRGNELWYHAPYRDDRTPSFRVNVEKLLWLCKRIYYVNKENINH